MKGVKPKTKEIEKHWESMNKEELENYVNYYNENFVEKENENPEGENNGKN